MIRLQRVGRKHEPVFRLVLTDSKNGPKSGKFLEILGNFDARNSEKAEFNVEKIKDWIGKGAKLSATIHNLLIKRKVIEGKKINNLPKKRPIISADSAQGSVPLRPSDSVASVPKEKVTSEILAEKTEEPTADSAESFVEPKEEAVAEKQVA